MSPHHKSFPLLNCHFKFYLYALLPAFTALLFYSCSPAKRTISPRLADKTFNKTIKVYIDELPSSYNLKLKEGGYLKNASDDIIKIDNNSSVNFTLANGFITADGGGKTFVSSSFSVFPSPMRQNIEYKGKKYRGEIRFIANSSKIYIINELLVEDYLKGVLPLEMGNIKGDENLEALKAFSIIARNFAYMKLDQHLQLFDVYPDTRDQVYGGASVEKELANKAIEETKGMILTYEHSPAKVFYFSSCGGATEDVGNVFSQKDIPYLTSVKDTKEPNCEIAPNYNWIEKYSGKTIIKRLFENRLIESTEYKCRDVEVKSRFQSGRVNELSIDLISPDGSSNSVKLNSNNIRRILKTADGKNILRSTMFDVETEERGSDIEIILKGKGNGHGVGLCQWGAIAKSRKGKTFGEILYFYLPGTRIEKIND